MTEEFLIAVRSIVEPRLADLGFRLEEYMSDVGPNDKEGSAVFFRSNDCRIQIYDSRRNGDINCMIAPLSADNIFGPYDRSGMWQYIVMYAVKKGVPREEIMNDELLTDFPTTLERLHWVRGRIEKYLPMAREILLKNE